MRKTILSIIFCLIVAFSCVSCNSSIGNSVNDDSAEGQTSLIYEKKYYKANKFDKDNIESNVHYIIFYKNGTGAYRSDENGQDSEIKFKYILGEDTVHMFYDGGHLSKGMDTCWNYWLWVGDGILYQTYPVQYINEEYLDRVPNLGT